MTSIRTLTSIGTALAVAGGAHAALNLRHLVSPHPPGAPIDVPVSVLIPARDEASKIGQAVASALRQRDVPKLTVTVLDDASRDGTAQAARDAGAGDPRLRVIGDGSGPPTGWLGKTWACQRLADQADGEVLVFLDADVALGPQAISSAVGLLRATGTDFASPWPRQQATGVVGRLVQPLQQWSWATTLPLGVAIESHRPSLGAANGQFLVVTRAAYDAVGGHSCVADNVLDDIGLARAMKRAGLRAALWDAHAIASCRMYLDAAQLRAGYRKSLWAAFGPSGAGLPAAGAATAGVCAALALAYLLPPVAILLGPDRRTRLVGALGYSAAVTNRAIVAGRTGSQVWPDSLGHPASIAVLLALIADSWLARNRGRTSWKDRPLPPRM